VCRSYTYSAAVHFVLQVPIQKTSLLPKAATVKLNTLIADWEMKTQSEKQWVFPVVLQVKQVVGVSLWPSSAISQKRQRPLAHLGSVPGNMTH